jgi:hypothetical protein
MARRGKVFLSCALVTVALALGSCGTSDLGNPTSPLDPLVPPILEAEDPLYPDPAPGEGPTSPAASLALRGDAGFAVSQLREGERALYDRFLREIADPGSLEETMRLAASDDIFTYGRPLHGYVQSVLTVFRVTGDLALLDHVDVIAERMRRELRDGWRDTNDGTDGTRDGYLNWVYRYQDTPDLQGKDTRFLDEIKTHGLIAMIAYALHLNRDLASPGGRDYAAHADFWRDYLVNHFEAKWRERRGVATGFPIMHHSDAHSYYTWTKWHYYMGLLTGDAAYLDEAHRMADIIWGEIRSVNVSGGPAYVWASNITALSASRNYLMSSGYASSVYGDVVTFHLEGFHNWASEEHMHAFARTLTEFMFDTDDPVRNGIAPDVGGGQPRAGLPEAPSSPRRTISTYATYQYALIAPWDPTQRVADISRAIQESRTSLTTPRLTAGLMLHTHLNAIDTAAITATTASTAPAP